MVKQFHLRCISKEDLVGFADGLNMREREEL